MRTPTKGKAPSIAAREAPTDVKKDQSPTSQASAHAGQPVRSMDGERQAAHYMARLQTHQAEPDELAVIVSMLYGEKLRGFCRAIEKALGVSR